MTNCVYTRHQGKKTPQDVSYCLKTLQNIAKDEWLSMCKKSGEKLGSLDVKEEKKEEKHQNQQQVKIPEIAIKKKSGNKKAGKIVVPSKEEIRALRSEYYNGI